MEKPRMFWLWAQEIASGILFFHSVLMVGMTFILTLEKPCGKKIFLRLRQKRTLRHSAWRSCVLHLSINSSLARKIG